MNCKQGDLAYYIGSIDEFHFRIVRCVKLVIDIYGKEGWEIYPPLPYVICATTNEVIDGRFIIDKSLRPIRDSDKEDEMLRIVRTPEKVKC